MVGQRFDFCRRREVGVLVKQHTESPLRLSKPPVFDGDELTVTVHAPVYRGAHVVRLFDRFKDENGKAPDVVREIFDGLAAAARKSDWASSATVRAATSDAVQLAHRLVDAQKASVADLDLDQLLAVAKDLRNDSVVPTRILAYALNEIGSNEVTATALLHHRHGVRHEETVEPYSEEEVAVIRQVAWGVVDEAYEVHEAYTQGLVDWLPAGTSVADRDWWSIPADVVIAAATARAKSGQRTRERKRTGQRKRNRSVASLSARAIHTNLQSGDMPIHEAIDWLLIHPDAFSASGWQAPVFFEREVMTAALVHHCFIDLRGFNLSTMRNTGVESLTPTGPSSSMVDTIKPRAFLHARETSGLRSRRIALAGFLGMVEALTKFSRHFRAQAGYPPEVADLFYARHDPNGTVENALGDLSITVLVRRIQTALNDAGLDGEGFTLSFKKLRLAAKAEGQKNDPEHQLHGQNRRTATTYDKKMLPVTVLHDSMNKSVDEIIEDGWDRVADAVENGTLTDLTVSACTSGGADPDADETRCEQGILACFACPNGVRTLDHIPGLIAMSRALEDSDDPLGDVVNEVLDHAPVEAVDKWRDRFDNDPSLTNTWTALASITLNQRSRQ